MPLVAQQPLEVMERIGQRLIWLTVLRNMLLQKSSGAFVEYGAQAVDAVIEGLIRRHRCGKPAHQISLDEAVDIINLP